MNHDISNDVNDKINKKSFVNLPFGAKGSLDPHNIANGYDHKYAAKPTPIRSFAAAYNPQVNYRREDKGMFTSIFQDDDDNNFSESCFKSTSLDAHSP